MLEIKSLTTGYRSGRTTNVISRNMTAALRPGELTSLLGANGAGKSTLLKTLSGFLPPLDGIVLIDGRPLAEYTPSKLGRKIGVVLTDRPEVIAMTVEEMVGLGRSPYTGFTGRLSAADRVAVERAMKSVGIEEMRHRIVDTLSDGERQKVMIAKALAQETPIILLDEPSAFLDYPSKVELMLTLRRLASDEGKTILLSTHDLNIALRLSDSLLLVDKNIGFAAGSPSELAYDGSLERFFPSPAIVLKRSPLCFDISEVSIS